MTDAELQVLDDAIGGTLSAPAGQDLVGLGDRPSYSLAILEGWAARYKILPDASRQITAIHLPGDFVDLHGFLLHAMDHAVTALSHCTVAMVSHEGLRLITETEPHLTRLLWMNTLVDSAIHRQWLVVMGQLETPARIAHLICELYVRLKAVGLTSGLSFRLPMKQSELADTIGVSAVHVNRSLQELRARELISLGSGLLVIKDWDQLRCFGQFDAAYLHHTQLTR